jgi:hypothetical protein
MFVKIYSYTRNDVHLIREFPPIANFFQKFVLYIKLRNYYNKRPLNNTN